MRLAADAAHQFGGVTLDRSKPLKFTLDGRVVEGFAGDTVLSAALAAGIDTYGRVDETAVALTDSFAPLVSAAGSRAALPMDRTEAVDGLELTTLGPRSRWPFGAARSLRRTIGQPATPAWMRDEPTTTLATDLAIVGGGLAGLAAAGAAIAAGRNVVLIERRPWVGGDAEYFGAVGDEESPEARIARLAAVVTGSPNATVLLRADVFQIIGETLAVHQVGGETPGGRVLAVKAARILLATGAPQRLPLFAGNRLPGVMSAVSAYHLVKRFGVAPGPAAILATQSNFGYRLALHLHDAGVPIERIVDTRIKPQSRFIDFAKASGLRLSTGQLAVSATAQRHGLSVGLANVGTSDVSVRLETPALVVSGGFQPDVSLWMLAGGMVHWAGGRLVASGPLDHVAIAGSAAGWRSHQAVLDSGRAAEAILFGSHTPEITENELSAAFETPDAPTPVAPVSLGVTFLDRGATLVRRPVATGASAEAAFAPRQALGVGDVAAAVDLVLIGAADAGAIAEERGAPGADLAASSWAPPPKASAETPAFVVGRFGVEPQRRHLVVDGKRVFAAGSLVYPPGPPRNPASAIGVIIEAASPGGIALIEAAAAQQHDRFIVEMLEGPSPARVRPN